MEQTPTEEKFKKTKSWEEAPWLAGAAEDIKAARKSGDTDDPLDVLLYDPIAIRLTHGFIKIGLSANGATLLSLFFGVTGAFLFYPQNRWINLAGILLAIFAAILDCCDGQIARLTHTSSQLGRVLDGLVDSVNYTAIYLALGLRMMGEKIPFTDTPWSFYIWIPLLAAGLCHLGQARMADYFRGLHLFFLKGSSCADLARSKTLKEELASLPPDSPWYERIYRLFYLGYTKAQEKKTPRAQALLDALEEKRGAVPSGLADAYITQSRKHIQLTNLLSFNIRSYVLFLLLMLRGHVFIIPFVILVLEGVKYYMTAKYEAIAEDIRCRYLQGSSE